MNFPRNLDRWNSPFVSDLMSPLFRADLKALSEKIQMRNTDAAFPYRHLDPKEVPNAISI
ncbi:unnamed protein product [Cyprideis torosa]|uniref:Uncharacterized protein n=1 Tax=Cyprideis torosa TaxID=163714 RepID=A0A7R8WDQ2_9CRUS|nr:unnamed protein product [Cyprideis torosa]CAG0894870.1 unnamed protein product [Cyprideis torosa]